jgi:hypothetical protein
VPTLDHNSDLYAEQGCPACAVMCHPGALYEGTLPLLTKTTVIVDRESNVNVTDHAQTTNVLRRQFGRACSWMILPPDFSRHFRLFFSQNRTALFPAPSKYVFLLSVTLAVAATAQITPPFPDFAVPTVTIAKIANVARTSIAVYTPETTIDSWECATKKYSEYLQPPMPTGSFLEVYYNHSDAIYKECEEKLPKPLTTFPACPSVAKASWCAVSLGSRLYFRTILTRCSTFNLS